jgi:RND family efflux transporter MFP subunit
MKDDAVVPTAPRVDVQQLPARPTPSGSSVTLSQDAIQRAGIVVGTASTPPGSAQLQVPAVVEPNAYSAVVVTPIAAGRVTSVTAVLGQQVRQGQALAQIYSPELVEAQSRYLTSRAELYAHERELRRTEKLAEIGSASQRELEATHAEHTAATTLVQSLRSRLTLLGMTDAQIDALSSASETTAAVLVPAPIDGVITSRSANVGLNVDPSMPLFTVVDLSTVWLVGNVYERDFSRVRVGHPVIVTTAAFPALMLEGTVSYIDPQVDPQARTARLRVEVPNPDGRLRLGMYAEMSIGQGASESAPRVAVPRAAVQIVGDRAVVYVADPSEAGRFLEREVQLGAASGENVDVINGLRTGDAVVVKGSFFLRAERERLGPAQTAPAAPPVRITVSDKGFEPARVAARAGSNLRLTFVRTSDATCATEVAIPAYRIERVLPLNQPVDIEFTPQGSGEVAFVCGANMLKGAIVVE